jgi:hypothetical protein
LALLTLVVAVTCAGASSALAGCAGELPDKNQPLTTATTGTGGGAVTGSTTSTTESQPYELSDQVASLWAESVQKLVALLQDTPPFASVQTAVADLKEQYVQKMVALGRQIIKLDPADQQTIYDRATDQLSAMDGATWFVSYKNLYDQYSAGSDDASQQFAIQLSAFDTLIQYAFFNVLKTNDPDEATRLSIE